MRSCDIHLRSAITHATILYNKFENYTFEIIKLLPHLSESSGLISSCFSVHRDELQAISREHELLEEDVERSANQLSKERKNKCKLEKVLADCADALKNALRVSAGKG